MANLDKWDSLMIRRGEYRELEVWQTLEEEEEVINEIKI